MKLHANGPWENFDGLLHNNGAYVQAYEMALLIDMDGGMLLKAGEKSMVTSHATKVLYAYHSSGMDDYCKDFRVIEFSNYEILTPDDICTIVNYLFNSPGEKGARSVLEPANGTALREQITRLQQIGF